MKLKWTLFLSIIVFIHCQLIPMPGMNRIKGKVRASDSKPVTNARITASPDRDSSDVRYAYTDTQGKWALTGLYGGRWTFTITAPAYISQSVEKKIKRLLPNRLNVTLDKIPSKEKLSIPLYDICLQFMKDHQIPGMAIGVVHQSQVIFTGEFGSKNFLLSGPITSHTVFNLASISKLFVAAAIIKLAHQGIIDLDAPVANYLPYFQLKQKVYRFITIRHLLTHRSGLPRGPKFLLFPPEHDDASLKRSVIRLKHLDITVNPGGKWRYSNIGYNILGALIAEVTGQSFESYIRDHIFLPLEMYDTTYFKAEIPAEQMACPHFRQGETILTAIDNDHRPYAPSAGLFSTLHDMIHWAQAHLANGSYNEFHLYPADVFPQVLIPQAETGLPSSEQYMGLGWFLGTYKGHRLAGHSGEQVGYKSHFLLLPDDHLGVIVMINCEEAPLAELSAQLLDLLLRFAPLNPDQDPNAAPKKLKVRVDISRGVPRYGIGGKSP